MTHKSVHRNCLRLLRLICSNIVQQHSPSEHGQQNTHKHIRYIHILLIYFFIILFIQKQSYFIAHLCVLILHMNSFFMVCFDVFKK